METAWSPEVLEVVLLGLQCALKGASSLCDEIRHAVATQQPCQELWRKANDALRAASFSDSTSTTIMLALNALHEKEVLDLETAS